MCCDGSLFGRVPLAPAEMESARRNGLRIVGDGAFEQPCAALVARSCSVYPERPLSCRRFVCRLHERHRTEGGPLEARLEAVRRVRELVAYLETSGWTRGDFQLKRPAALARAPGTRAAEAFAELARRLEEDFARPCSAS